MPKKPFTLTPDNYFERPITWVSNSMISDYLKSPDFFFRKYLDGGVDLEITPSMKLGSLVDDLLTRGETKYVEKVKQKDEPDIFEEQKKMDQRYVVPKEIWDKAHKLYKYIKAQPFWRTGIRSAQLQRTLSAPFSLSASDKSKGYKLCGMADRIDVFKNGTYRILDLKTTTPQKHSTKKKWHYACEEMGYYRQLALYQYLFALEQDIPREKIKCAHAVFSIAKGDIIKGSLFYIPQPILDVELAHVLQIAGKILNQEFEEAPLTWKDAEDLDVVVFE